VGRVSFCVCAAVDGRPCTPKFCAAGVCVRNAKGAEASSTGSVEERSRFTGGWTRALRRAMRTSLRCFSARSAACSFWVSRSERRSSYSFSGVRELSGGAVSIFCVVVSCVPAIDYHNIPHNGPVEPSVPIRPRRAASIARCAVSRSPADQSFCRQRSPSVSRVSRRPLQSPAQLQGIRRAHPRRAQACAFRRHSGLQIPVAKRLHWICLSQTNRCSGTRLR
jgi:hypothetical protein